MSSACIQILVGVAFLVSEILLLSKTAKFPFLSMDYSPFFLFYLKKNKYTLQISKHNGVNGTQDMHGRTKLVHKLNK